MQIYVYMKNKIVDKRKILVYKNISILLLLYTVKKALLYAVKKAYRTE